MSTCVFSRIRSSSLAAGWLGILLQLSCTIAAVSFGHFAEKVQKTPLPLLFDSTVKIA